MTLEAERASRRDRLAMSGRSISLRNLTAQTVLTVCAVLVLGVGTAYGQVDTLWTRTFSGAGNVYADFIVTSDGGFALGSNKWGGDPNRRDGDFYLAKLDSLGITEWDSLYAGSPDGVNRNDVVYQLAQMSDGGFLLVGDTRGGPIGMAIRTDSSGSRRWHNYMPHGEVSFQTCETTADNDIIAGGGAVVWRLDDTDSGSVVWREQFPPSGTIYHSTTTSDGKFLFAGTSDSEEFDGNDFYAVKFDLDGEIEWENYFGTDYLDDAGAVIETYDGGCCIVGTQRFGFDDSTNAMIVRVDGNGEEIWKRVYDELPRGNFLFAVVETPDHGFAAVGTNEEFDFFLVRVDSIGEVLWSTSFHRRGSNKCHDIFLMPDGSYVLGGPSSDGAWLIQTTPDSLNLPPNQEVLFHPAFPFPFSIFPCYPNPFNSSTRIAYTLATPSDVQLRVYDLMGWEVATLFEGRQMAGGHQALWDGRNALGAPVSSGVYFVRLETPGGGKVSRVVMSR